MLSFQVLSALKYRDLFVVSTAKAPSAKVSVGAPEVVRVIRPAAPSNVSSVFRAFAAERYKVTSPAPEPDPQVNLPPASTAILALESPETKTSIAVDAADANV